MKKLLLAIAALFCLAGVSYAQSAQEQLKKDLPHYRAYEQDNQALDHAPYAVLMGDSITWLWNHLHPQFFTTNDLVCRGISGQTTMEMLLRFRQDVIAHKPKYAVIMAGCNDIALNSGYITLQNTFGNIRSMCETALASGIKVLVCSTLPVSRFSWRPDVDPVPVVPELNRMLKEYAAQTKGVTYVDYFSSVCTEENKMREDLSNDGCHPNSEGYDILEPILMKALKIKK